MIIIEKTAAYQEYMLQKSFRKKVRALSIFLMTSLYIAPYERQLVGLFSDGNEADNAEVIFNWIREQACCPSCLKSIDATEIQKRLIQHLLAKAEIERVAS